MHRLGARLPIAVVQLGLALTLIAAFCGQSFALPLQLTNGGTRYWCEMVTRVSNVLQVWPISSESIGEGRLVAAVAFQETRPNSYVLRERTFLVVKIKRKTPGRTVEICARPSILWVPSV